MNCIIRIFICCLWIFDRNGIKLNLIPLWFHHDHDLTMITIMITLMISPLSLQWFNYDQYHDFTMITSKILPESPHVPLFRHDQYDDINRIWPLAWNCQCAFGVSSYSLFCTKKPLCNLITSPPPSEKKLKRHKQTNIHSLQNITYQHDVTNHFSKTDFANAWLWRIGINSYCTLTCTK